MPNDVTTLPMFTVPPGETKMLDLFILDRADICMAFGVPPRLLKHDPSKATVTEPDGKK